jgi:hypothetical protein
MPKLTIAVTGAIGIAAVALLFPNQVLKATVVSGQAGLAQMAGEARPIKKAALLCYGLGWRGYGYYPWLLGLSSACWDTLPYGGPVYPVYPAPAYDPSAAVYYYCDRPRGYYPQVQTCSTAWRTVPTIR